jgi:hypothetical protein
VGQEGSNEPFLIFLVSNMNTQLGCQGLKPMVKIPNRFNYPLLDFFQFYNAL